MELYAWGCIYAGFCTLHELQTVYTLDDLVEMNTGLALRNALTDYEQASKK